MAPDEERNYSSIDFGSSVAGMSALMTSRDEDLDNSKHADMPERTQDAKPQENRLSIDLKKREEILTNLKDYLEQETERMHDQENQDPSRNNSQVGSFTSKVI